MRQRLADYRVFWRQFRQAYNSTGAVLPSGRNLSAALSSFVRDGQATGSKQNGTARGRRILEVGPGTGAVTALHAEAARTLGLSAIVERLTVFKFNSAWRRDSYLLRDVREQERMLARLRANAAAARLDRRAWADRCSTIGS